MWQILTRKNRTHLRPPRSDAGGHPHLHFSGCGLSPLLPWYILVHYGWFPWWYSLFIRLTFSTVLIRCAMTRTVFPFTSPEIAFWISVSLSTSRDAVASSNRMTGASFKSARAMVSPLSNLFQFFHNKSKQLCLFPPSQKTDRHKMPLSTVPSQNFHLQNKYHFLHCLYETKSALFQPVENQHC